MLNKCLSDVFCKNKFKILLQIRIFHSIRDYKLNVDMIELVIYVLPGNKPPLKPCTRKGTWQVEYYKHMPYL